MTIYQTLEQLVDLFPPDKRLYKTTGEVNTPCPFCSLGDETWYLGNRFFGEDRLVWFTSGNGTFCRQCGYHAFQQIVDLLDRGSSVDEHLAMNLNVNRNPTQLVLHNDHYIQHLQDAVDRPFWKKFGWSDSTIDRFKLGYGLLYPNSTRLPRHVIPFKPWTIHGEEDGWALEGRLNDRSEEALPDEPYNKKTLGLTGNRYFWYINENPSTDTAAIVEGPKDAISAYELEFESIGVAFGTNGWNEAKTEFLVKRGIKNIYVFGDNDDAGRLFNESIKQHCQKFDVTCYFLTFPTDAPNGFDLTNFLARTVKPQFYQPAFSRR